jgi:hypothetical protein
MTMQPGLWTTEDFDQLSWHDVHVHGFRFAEIWDDEGEADLVFDIDYILKWEQVAGAFQFTVCPAELRFHRAFGLKFDLDYQSPSAGMRPFSIDGITKEPIHNNVYKWSLVVNWPKGRIGFEAPAFTLKLTGEPVVQDAQFLAPVDRGRAL